MQRVLAVSILDKLLPVALVLLGSLVTAVALGSGLIGFSSTQGIGPNKFALAVSGSVLMLAGIIRWAPAGGRRIGEWLLIGVAALAAGFAADLLVINGLPEVPAKLGLLASVALGLLISGLAIPTLLGRQASLARGKVAAEDKTRWLQFLAVAAQLSLLVLVVRQYRLENQALYHNVMYLSLFGFVVHYFLPSHYRLPFFVLLTAVALYGIFGFANVVWLVGIGLGLIGICHLPISHIGRVAALLVAGAALIALRTGWVEAGWLDVIWPVLASMFMFRLIIYVYDLQHSKAKPTLASTLAYFFLLPNIVFPFFPVVDYSTFRRTYFDEEQHRIYQKGLQWMLRGILQLIVYRYLNYYLVIGPEAVTSAPELVRYLVTNFSLYIRISGQFHLIIGLLHLFGFNLPETNHSYFLASSFTDLWRRINIYWKDFMMKVFYYPTYFRIRKWGATVSLVVATLFVFFLTWFLHAYQWFWLRGSFLFTTPDILFWLLLAMLVVINTLYEAKRSRKRTLGQHTANLREIAGQAVRAAGTFTVMAVLWSLWSSASIRDWLGMFSVLEANLSDVGALVGSFVAIVLVFGFVLWVGALFSERKPTGVSLVQFLKVAGVTGGGALALFLVGNPLVYNRLGASSEGLIRDLTTNRLSEREAGLLQQGYYEDLVGVHRFNSPLWEIYTKRPSGWVEIRNTEAVRLTNDNFILELVPSAVVDFNGTRLTTNRWGMRDRDYELEPYPDTYRIALTGPSFVMGLGVEFDEGFEWLLEDRLNQEYAGGTYARYEILNFGVPGYSAIQELMVLEKKALEFHPNALFFVSHQREEEAIVRYLADRVSVGAELPYADLMALVQGAGTEPGMAKGEAERLLTPLGPQLLSVTYQHIVDVALAHNVLPVWILIPTLEDPLHEAEVSHLRNISTEAGFIVLDLSDAYAGQDADALVVAYWDKHPNAEGHRLIAEHLYDVLMSSQEDIPLFR